MFPYEVYKRLREEQRGLAVRIGRLEQFIDNHDNMGTNKELNDDYMDILRDQLDAMKDYNTCLVQRIGIAVTGRDVKQFRESCKPDPRDPDPKQDSDGVVACEEYCDFNCYFDPAPKDFPFDPAIL